MNVITTAKTIAIGCQYCAKKLFVPFASKFEETLTAENGAVAAACSLARAVADGVYCALKTPAAAPAEAMTACALLSTRFCSGVTALVVLNRFVTAPPVTLLTTTLPSPDKAFPMIPPFLKILENIDILLNFFGCND